MNYLLDIVLAGRRGLVLAKSPAGTGTAAIAFPKSHCRSGYYRAFPSVPPAAQGACALKIDRGALQRHENATAASTILIRNGSPMRPERQLVQVIAGTQYLAPCGNLGGRPACLTGGGWYKYCVVLSAAAQSNTEAAATRCRYARVFLGLACGL